MGLKKLAKDTALLTASALVMRCISLAYQVWLAGRIGAAGVGLWQLVLSVHVLAATLAISGIRFTTTRLVAEELDGGGADRAVGRCLGYAAFFGSAACLILCLWAEPVGFLWVRDARTVRSLRALAFSLPLISLSCVLNGWFIATGRAWKSAAVQVAEQVCGIVCVMLLLSRAPEGDLERCCAAIAWGHTAADGVSLLLVAALFLLDRRGVRAAAPEAPEHLTQRMLRIALPLALSAYARTGLTTLENLLVPQKLRASGLSADRALSGYGTITGMVFPIIGFPSCLLSALAELSVPELTAAQVRGQTQRIGRTVSRLMRWTLGFSLACALLLLGCADMLGMLIYHSPEAGKYIRLLAPVVPVMYLDIVTDGCLKGLGQMLWSMGFNIAEAVIGVLLVLTVLPARGLDGYVAMLYCCEIFNFAVSFLRLRRVCDLRLLPPLQRRRARAIR